MAVVQGCGGGDRAEKAGKSGPVVDLPEETSPDTSLPAPPFVQEQFVNRRTINFVSSEPPNNALLTAPPGYVTIRFSKGLGAGCFINVKREGFEVTTGPVAIASDNLSMTVPVAAGVTGNYKVTYAAYFFSGYYEEGSFGFSVNVQ
jgi:methionine-rich copper-binding protein CopC